VNAINTGVLFGVIAGIVFDVKWLRVRVMAEEVGVEVLG